MKKPIWPLALIVIGFGLMAACIAIILSMSLSETAHLWAIIGESFGVGLGSIGLGMFIATRRR